MRIAFYMPFHCSGEWLSHIYVSLCHHMQGDGVEVVLTAPTTEARARRPFLKPAVPVLLNGPAYRLNPSGSMVRRLGERVFLRRARRADVAYLFAGVPLAVFHELRRRGTPIVLERINCHRRTVKPLLDDAYARLGLPPQHGITPENTREEDEKLALADLVFAPSPLVAQSLLDAGVPAAKILRSSYGFEPDRVRVSATRPADGELTVLFVGGVLVRKGIHLLLEAWERSGVKGRLLIAGKVWDRVLETRSRALARPDVIRLGHVEDIHAVYAGAHVFAFPSLEEGSPLVLYEAMAHGLAMVVSPMAAGEVLRDGVEGLVCEPHDGDGLVEALRRLAGDAALRRELGAAAQRRVQDYTWAKVGARRRAMLRAALAHRAAPAVEGRSGK